MSRKSGYLAVLVLIFSVATPLYAQGFGGKPDDLGGGCQNSPENPTLILAGLAPVHLPFHLSGHASVHAAVQLSRLASQPGSSSRPLFSGRPVPPRLLRFVSSSSNSSATLAGISPAPSSSPRLNPVMLVLACACAAVGLLAISNTVLSLLNIWRNDDLRSIGMVVPFVSFALILRAWRGISWRAEGSWWGFAMLAAVAALMFVHDQTLLVVMVNKDWLLQIPPLPLIAMAYAAAMVLLFGGVRLLRAAWFGVLFMGVVIPVPHTFTRAVDLPLQHASATVAGRSRMSWVRISLRTSSA